MLITSSHSHCLPGEPLSPSPLKTVEVSREALRPLLLAQSTSAYWDAIDNYLKPLSRRLLSRYRQYIPDEDAMEDHKYTREISTPAPSPSRSEHSGEAIVSPASPRESAHKTPTFPADVEYKSRDIDDQMDDAAGAQVCSRLKRYVLLTIS